MLSFYAFAVHLTDAVKNQLMEGNSDILATPAGCTSNSQPMDVCLS